MSVIIFLVVAGIVLYKCWPLVSKMINECNHTSKFWMFRREMLLSLAGQGIPTSTIVRQLAGRNISFAQIEDKAESTFAQPTASSQPKTCKQTPTAPPQASETCQKCRNCTDRSLYPRLFKKEGPNCSSKKFSFQYSKVTQLQNSNFQEKLLFNQYL